MKPAFTHNWSTERISQRVFYVLIGVIVLVFALFYLVGFNLPFIEDPAFKAPFFTGAVLVLMYLLLLGALCTAAWAVYTTLKKRGKGGRMDNNIPVKKLAYGMLFITLGLLVFTFLFGSTGAMLINGKDYTDAFWLRMADMFINTTAVLMVIAIGAAIFGATRYYLGR